eukprot:4664024-Prymnesium_polylepis.1
MLRKLQVLEYFRPKVERKNIRDRGDMVLPLLRALVGSALLVSSAAALQPLGHVCGRRHMMTTSLSGALLLGLPSCANADGDGDGFVSLSDEEMAARVARKQELLRQRSGGKTVSSLDIRSDINPESAVALRSRSIIENAKETLAKQEEMKKRNKAQKRDDLCEMLGRGC